MAHRSTYSIRLFKPFAKVLSQRFGVNEASYTKLLPFKGAEERVPASLAHELLQMAVDQTGDESIGLKAGRSMMRGDGGAIDYAICSAANVRDALTVIARYIHLVNDALEIRVEDDGKRVFVHLESQVVMPPAAEDFMVASVYTRHFRTILRDTSSLECWLRRTAPTDAAEHENTFSPATVRFASPSCGFLFERASMDDPLRDADPNLHSVMKRYAEQLLEGLPQGENFAAGVRAIVARQLSSGQLNIGAVARELHMSARTLGRRLEGEGTTFTDLVDDVRKRLALRYVGKPDLPLTEIAFMLGFAHPAAFHRAFKRWTGQTPRRYRSDAQALG